MKLSLKITPLFIGLIICISCICAKAQSPVYQIKGTLTNNDKADVTGLQVQLLRAADSALVKMELADKDGHFAFDQIKAGNYRIRISDLSFQVYRSAVIDLSANVNLGTIQLQKRNNTLKEVNVSASRPYIQQQYDKTVLNVAGSITATGSTAMEVLEKAPGISVDQNDNISMRGRQGVLVMIDGKRVPMTGAELATLLRGTSANAIDKIDLITNPSAKYDAQGNAGIIDIKLKKDNRNGTNGSLTGSWGQGIYRKNAAGLTLNNRTKNVNVFGSYNYNYAGNVNNLDISRQFYELNTTNFLGAYEQRNRFYSTVNSHNYRLGVDYNLSPKTIIGIVGNGLNTGIDRHNANRADSYNAQNIFNSYFLTNGTANSKRSNYSVNLNLKHTLDSTGRELTTDFDYARYNNNDVQDFTSRFFDLNNAPTRNDYILHGDLNGALNIKSAKVDYSQPLKGKGRFETGLKSSWVNSDNDVQFFNRSNGNNVLDAGKSNQFLYKENINAAYANVNKTWGKFDLQAGLRLENTNTQGIQMTSTDKFKRNYTQLFPSAYAGYHLSAKNEIGLSLSRRINRPTYNQLNPFIIFLDSTTYSGGNPELKPELSNSFEFTYTYNQKYIAKLSYTRTTDNIVNILSLVPNQDRVVIQTFRNLAVNNYYALSLTVPVTVGNWLSSSNNGVLYYANYKGNLVNTNLNNGLASYNINSSNTVTLGKGFTAEVIASYQSKSVYGFLNINGIFTMAAGVQKQFWDKRASLKLAMTDIFHSNKANGLNVSNGYTENFRQWRDTQVGTLSFTYRFGKNQLAPARRRATGAEDEKRRAG